MMSIIAGATVARSAGRAAGATNEVDGANAEAAVTRKSAAMFDDETIAARSLGEKMARFVIKQD